MSGWIPAHDAELRANFDGGLPLSYAEVAKVLNDKFGTRYTRNATIGRANRLGLTCPWPKSKKTGPKAARQPKATPAQRPDIAIRKAETGPKKPPEPYVPIETDIPPGTVPLLELGLDGCKWPSGDGPFLFCNRPQHDGLVYCAGHAALAYRSPERR